MEDFSSGRWSSEEFQWNWLSFNEEFQNISSWGFLLTSKSIICSLPISQSNGLMTNESGRDHKLQLLKLAKQSSPNSHPNTKLSSTIDKVEAMVWKVEEPIGRFTNRPVWSLKLCHVSYFKSIIVLPATGQWECVVSYV